MKRALAVALATVCGFILVACASGGDGGGTGSCGNGVKDGVDQCDGTDLGGVTCQVLGFKGGTPLCNPTTCQLDLAPCCQDTCANVGDTQCAGTALQTCTQQASGCRGWTLTADCAQSGGGAGGGRCAVVRGQRCDCLARRRAAGAGGLCRSDGGGGVQIGRAHV